MYKPQKSTFCEVVVRFNNCIVLNKDVLHIEIFRSNLYSKLSEQMALNVFWAE